jgi:DNA-binding NarL/FixJ family response regulator
VQESRRGRDDQTVLGRETEFAAVRHFLEHGGTRTLVVTGDAGIGKTTLWEAGIAAARSLGFRVLVARATGADARLSFSALIDLLDGVNSEELVALPKPQLHALEVALVRAEPIEPLAESAVALGFRNALQTLAGRPLLVAVDDVPWLDAPSADALAFAARRLDGDMPLFLLARRRGRVSALERALAVAGGLDRLELGPLSYGAIRRLLGEKVGLTLPRHLLRRLVDMTLGNPLFALEVARELSESGLPPMGEDLPVPESIEDQLRTRVARLPAATRRLLLATALSADLTLAQLAAVTDPGAIEEAIHGGLLVVVDDVRVRASHPLLAAAARRHARPRARRELHLELAAVVADDGLRLRHLALAAEGADERLAADLAGAAAGVASRGAPREAVELADHALRLTPADSAARGDRLLTLAGYLDVVGEAQRVTDLITPELESLPRGSARVRAQLLLSEGGGVTSVTDHQRHLDAALAEAQDDPALRANVLAKMSIHSTAACVEQVQQAEAWAVEALSGATGGHSDIVRLSLHALAWARALAGRPLDDLTDRFDAESSAASHLVDSVERVSGLRCTWRGDVAAARAILGRLLALADERGELWSYVVLRLHLCELELRAGEWEAASGLLDEWSESAEAELLVAPSYERCRALLAVGRGYLDDVERWAAPARAGAEATGARWQSLETLRATGTAALLAHDPAAAAESLRAVWEHTRREGVDDPGAFPVAPDLVEALAELGELDEARAVTDHLQLQAERQQHPWGLVTAARCDGLIGLAADSNADTAAAALDAAASAYADLGLPFDAARTLLVLGRLQRRRRRWAAARTALDRAAAAFESLGSPGWVEETRSDLARVGARRPRSEGGLSPMEERVAELAAAGLSNKEIAQTLFVTSKTVEAHLTHIYAKLGLRSRAQLAARSHGDGQGHSPNV